MAYEYEYVPSLYLINKDAEDSRKKHSKKDSEKVAVFYHVLVPVLLLIRLAGRFPYAIEQTPSQEMHLGWAVYSAAVGAFQFAGLYFTTQVAYSHGGDNFDEKIFSFVTAITCVILCLTLFLTWLEAPWLCAYFDKWKAYQDDLRSFGVTLDARLQKWLFIWILALFPYTGTVAYFTDVHQGNPYGFPTYLLLQMGSYLIFALWFFMVLFIQDTATHLLARIGDATAGQEVATLKKLWLTLANLTVELGQILGLSLILFMISCCIIGISNSYSIMFFLRDCFIGNCDRSYHQIPIITQVGFLIVSATIIIAICEHGHRCSVSVGSNFLKEILKINFSLKNESTQRELQSLVQTILLRYPDIALGGFFTVNRRLLTRMVSSAITYLIVLLQFRSSGVKT